MRARVVRQQAILVRMRLFAASVLVGAAMLPGTAASDRVDDYVRDQIKSRRIPGLSLAVVVRGKLVKAEGYGVASLELDVPATRETVYEIGSISKQIAADAILLLVEDGKLRLDDPISRYLDDAPPAWAPITIRHVLTHTAGLADFDSGNIGFSYRREYTPREFVALLAAQPLQFAAGTRWMYTNAFPLLGMVVERVSGQPYTAFVERRIFAPLEMRSARFKREGDVVPHRADGYVIKDGIFRRGEPLRPMVIAPNGGVMINVVDFARWDIAITTRRLLQEQSLRELTTPVRLADGRTVSHGLGWFMDTFNGHEFGAHWGTTVAGYSAVIRRYVNDGVTVIALANVDEGGGFAVDAISKAVANVYVPGVEIHGLAPRADGDPRETARLMDVLRLVAAGTATAAAPGLADRLSDAVRERLGDALRTPVTIDALGEERIGPRHFVGNPAVVRVRRYRARTSAGARYLTVQLGSAGEVLGVIVEA
jgi:CubicO group peptidase (beta-lactamase class C family)